MIRPNEMKQELPMQIHNGMSTTLKVWEILMAGRDGNLERLKEMVDECPGLIYAQYNYTPPIHLAVRQGHAEVVEYLLSKGALDPEYRTYPFLDSLLTIAKDRDYHHIAVMLEQYISDPALCKFKGDNGKIGYMRTDQEQEFEKAVNDGDLDKTKQFLQDNPALVRNKTFFWSEGIMMMPAKAGNQKMLELLMSFGATVPAISKWGQYYYFNHYPIATFLMENGMNPNHMTWHHVTLLHDMAQKAELQKAELLINHGAEINALEEEYQSTPLGLAARWGHYQMVEFLLKQGADPGKAGATWATPLAWARKKGHVEIENVLKKAGAAR